MFLTFSHFRSGEGMLQLVVHSPSRPLTILVCRRNRNPAVMTMYSEKHHVVALLLSRMLNCTFARVKFASNVPRKLFQVPIRALKCRVRVQVIMASADSPVWTANSNNALHLSLGTSAACHSNHCPRTSTRTHSSALSACEGRQGRPGRRGVLRGLSSDIYISCM